MKLRLRSLPCLLLGLAPFAAVRAQVSPAPATTASDAETIVQLKPFDVTSTTEHGYSTTSSLAGARMALPVIDTSSSIIVINEKLLEDLMPQNMADTLNLVSGMFQSGALGGGLDSEAQYSIRGYTSSGTFRDGLPDYQITGIGGFNYTEIERIEINKGPNGVLFGQHSAGGVVNLVSKRPLPEPMNKLTLSGGSHDFWQTEVDTSNFLDSAHHLGYRVAASIGDTDGPMELPGEPSAPSWAVNPSLSYSFASGATVWAWASIIEDNSLRRNPTTYAFGTANGGGRAFYPMADIGINTVVLRNLEGVRSRSFELGGTKSHQLGGIATTTRLVARYSSVNSNSGSIRTSGTTRWFDPQLNQIISNASGGGLGNDDGFYDKAITAPLAYYARSGVRLQEVDERESAWLYSLDTNLDFTLGPTKHNILAYGQFTQTSDETPNRLVEIPDVKTLPPDVLAARGWKVVNGVGFIENWPNPQIGSINPSFVYQYATTNQLRSWPKLTEDAWAFGVGDNITLLKERLILVGGARYDGDNAVSYPDARPGTTVPSERLSDGNWTTRYGGVVKLYAHEDNKAVLFFDHSGTFVTVYDRDKRLSNLYERFPNRHVSSDEVGTKVDLWNGRVTGTLSYFDENEDNILLQGEDLTGSILGFEGAYSYPGGSRSTKGIETDLSANILAGWDAIVSYAHLHSMLSDGLPAFSMPFETFGLVNRFELQHGPLKGLSLLYQFNYWGSSYLNRSTPGFQLPSGNLSNIVIGYHFRKIDVRLRIGNLFDQIEALPSSFWTQVGITEGRSARLSVIYRY